MNLYTSQAIVKVCLLQLIYLKIYIILLRSNLLWYFLILA